MMASSHALTLHPSSLYSCTGSNQQLYSKKLKIKSPDKRHSIIFDENSGKKSKLQITSRMKKVVRDLYESSKHLQKDSISGLFNFNSVGDGCDSNKENVMRHNQSSLPELHKLSVSTYTFDPGHFSLEFPNKCRRSSFGQNRVKKVRTMSQSSNSTSCSSGIGTYTNVSDSSLWPYVNMFSKEEEDAVRRTTHADISRASYTPPVGSLMSNRLPSVGQHWNTFAQVSEEDVDEGMCTDSEGLSDSWSSCKTCSHHKSPSPVIRTRRSFTPTSNTLLATSRTGTGTSRTRSKSITNTSAQSTHGQGDLFNAIRSPNRRKNSIKKSAIMMLTPSKRQKSSKKHSYENVSGNRHSGNSMFTGSVFKRPVKATEPFTYENLCPLNGGKTLSQTNILNGTNRLPPTSSSAPIYQNINPLPSRPIIINRSTSRSISHEEPLPKMTSMSTYEEMFMSKPVTFSTRDIPRVTTKPAENAQVKLVKLIQLDKIIKSKWITGMVVTKKNIAVVDSKLAYLLDMDGNLKRLIGIKGADKLTEPVAVTELKDGNLAFTDQYNQTIKIFTTKGQYVKTIRPDDLSNINGVASSEFNDIFVVGTDTKCVCAYNSSNTSSIHIPIRDSEKHAQEASQWFRPIPSMGLQNTRIDFQHPNSIAYNPLTRDLIIGDDHKHFVCAVTSSGRLSWKFCAKGDRPFYPSSINVTHDGYIFIGDLYNHKVYMIDSSGKYIKTLLAKDNGLGCGPGALATDSNGHIFVADDEKTIKVYKYNDGFTMCRRVHMCH